MEINICVGKVMARKAIKKEWLMVATINEKGEPNRTTLNFTFDVRSFCRQILSCVCVCVCLGTLQTSRSFFPIFNGFSTQSTNFSQKFFFPQLLSMTKHLEQHTAQHSTDNHCTYYVNKYAFGILSFVYLFFRLFMPFSITVNGVSVILLFQSPVFLLIVSVYTKKAA